MLVWTLASALLMTTAATAADRDKAITPFSPYANRDYPTNVFFGDTHLHTALSADAGTFGNRLGLDDAYRFTRGEQVTSSTGYAAKLGRPLDFVVIADHESNTSG